jgi:excisionase family DNA binding protein
MVTVLAYTLTDAAAAVGLSERTLRDAIGEGSLTAHYSGRKPLIRPADLEAWLESLPTERRA